MLPAIIFIGDDIALLIDARTHFGEMGRAVVVPAMLIPAHVLHAHGLARRRRHDGGGLGGVLVA